jgi:hypothetical protein
MACEWIEKEVKPLLEDYSRTKNADEIYWFNFKDGTLRMFKKRLAKFLKSIGGAKGTKYGEMMIFRYLCDPNHSSLSCQEDSLKTSIYRELKAL